MDISVNGPKIYFEIPIFGGIRITQTTVSLLAVTILLIVMACLVTRRLSKRPGRMQVIVEKLITMLYGLVEDTMGAHNRLCTVYRNAFSLVGLWYADRYDADLPLDDGGFFRHPGMGTCDLRHGMVSQYQKFRLQDLAQGLYRADRRDDTDEHCQRDRTARFDGIPSFR